MNKANFKRKTIKENPGVLLQLSDVKKITLSAWQEKKADAPAAGRHNARCKRKCARTMETLYATACPLLFARAILEASGTEKYDYKS